MLRYHRPDGFFPVGRREGGRYALFNALVIAAYTLIDGMGVRRSLSPVSYTLWIFLLTAISMAAWAIVTKKTVFI